MLPAAPARLSTITCWPKTWLKPTAMIRPNTSAPLPAEPGTM
jgi:hypothetical protein